MNLQSIKKRLIELAKDELPDETELAEMLPLQEKLVEKYDEYLPEDLLTECYGVKAFNSMSAKEWILSNLV